MHYVYILYSQKLMQRYIGSTDDLRARLKRHNAKSVTATRDGIPWKLIYYECFMDKRDAIAEELFFKSGQGRARLVFLLKNTMNGL